jgi:hypothetical protein
LVFLNFVVFSVMSEVRAAPLTDEEKGAFKWFDGLGFPRFERLQWVNVATGQWSQSGNRPRENHYFAAFLLNLDGDRFTVFTTDASTLTFVRTSNQGPEYERVGYEPRNLEQDARLCLQSLRHPPTNEEERLWQRFGERLTQRSEVFILARACAANGLDELAHDLCVQAEAMPDRRTDGKTAPFIKRVSDDFAYSTIWKAFLDFEDPKIARPQLLEAFQNFVTHYPDSEYTPRARETATILERMVKEDEIHAKAATRPFDQMRVTDRVAELIFQLRDQNGHQWFQPGACNIFLDERGEKSPASQLVAIGFDAVPQLIDALNDDRFTRSVGFHRNFYFSHFVLRVGDCAEAILSRIACRPFWVNRSSTGAMLKDGQVDDTRRQVQQWWAEVQKNGEKQVLVDAVASGDEKASEQARRLVQKYPAAALKAIIQGIAKTQSDWLRVQLVQAAGGLQGDGPLPFLTGQLTGGASIDVRVAAASALRHRGKSQATAAMIDEWDRQCDAVQNRDREAPASLVEFLISSDDPAAIHALKERIQDWPVSSRLGIVESLGESENMIAMGMTLPGTAASAKLSPATLDAIEDLLIARLDDVEELGGMSGVIGDDPFWDPRVCDMAAHSLASRWKELYRFKFSAPLAERNRQRVMIQNTWRECHNLPPLPLPQPRKIQPVPAERINPLLERLASPDEVARTRTAGDIEALGLGAMPAVREAIQAFPKNDPRESALNSLARRLSCRVDQVEVLPANFQPEGALKSALVALKGNALTSESFIRVLIAFATTQPPGIRGMKLFAARGDDFTGVAIRLQMIAGKHTDDSVWDIQERVTAGDEGLLGTFGEAFAERLQKPEGWDDLTQSLNAALKTSPETPLEVRISLTRN